MNNIYNNQNHHNNQQGNHQNSNNNNVHAAQSINNVSSTTENTVQKSLMKNISVAIVLLVVVYGGYLTFNSQLVNKSKNLNEGINTKAESYILLNDLASKLDFKNSNIEKYSFDLNTEKYDGYAISTISYVGVTESPFNDELRNNGFVENSNDLAEGHTAGLSVYSKDNLICIIKNDAVNPNSWGTDNPDYSSTQTFACADKNIELK